MEKRLYRSSRNRVLAGVCGGLGEYFRVDPVIIRLLAVIFTIMGGAGLIAYIIAMIVIPSEDSPGYSDSYREAYSNGEGTESGYKEYPESYEKSNRNTALVLGLILIGMGALIALRYFMPWIPGKLVLAVVLVILGAFVIFGRK